MSLPKGYTELEWIKSSGTQYIDTGYKATSENYRIQCKFYFDTLVNSTVPFGGGSSTDIISVLLRNNTQFHFYVGSGSVSATDFNVAKNVEYEMECLAKNGTFTVTVNGTKYSGSYSGSINKDYSLAIFGNNASGTVGQLASMRYSAFQIYDNDVLVRDFVPCKNPSGAVGLYDEVSGAFYANKGTGSFAAGSVVEYFPSAPEYFNAFGSGGAVHLYWAQDENTLGYLLYRNGELIADTAETSYTDTGAEIYSGQQYTLIPYNDAGNGISVSLNVIVKGDPRPLGDLITDRTATDVATRTRKGVYNASDLNRVAASAEYVHDILDGLGYRVPDQPNRAWFTNEIPDKNEIETHHNAVVGLDVIRYAHEKVVLPPNLEKLTYERANNIEKFLLLCGEAAERIPEGYIYSDEIYGGDG